MKCFKKVEWVTAILLASCLCGSVNGRYQPPVSAQFDTNIIESVMKLPRPATLAPGDPELPRVYLETTYVAPSGKTISVAAGGDVQRAINEARPGDVIKLEAGATFTGNFRLPNKNGSGWIVIRSSAADSSLPPPGARITPEFSSVMAKLVSPNSNPAAQTDAGAHHYRFIGVEFCVAPGQNIYNIISFDAEQSSLATIPHDLIVDRCYIHGANKGNVSRGIALNCARAAVIDSYISNCHGEGFDTQAIAGWNGPGPFKIVNNYLEGAGENFMLGGADPSIKNLTPSDIEFRSNHVYKPRSWKKGDPAYAGTPWTIKNLFELKNAQRVLIDRNVFENNWADAQTGFAILFTPRNQKGKSPWSVVQDVTFTNNIVRHSGGGFNVAGPDNEAGTSLPSRRILIKNNLIDDIDGVKWGSDKHGPADSRFIQLVGGPLNITVDHNTIFQTGSLIVADVAPSPGFVFRNNFAPHNEYGVSGSDRSPGADTLNFYFPGHVFRKNVIVGAQSRNYPQDNFYPGSLDKVGFVDRAKGNYRLTASSPYRNAGTDGKDIGCDFDAVGVPPVSSTSGQRPSATHRIGGEEMKCLCSVSFHLFFRPFPHSSTSTRTRARPSRMKPSFFAATFDKSIMTPSERLTRVGPRSMMRTSIDLLFFRLVTRAIVPSGYDG